MALRKTETIVLPIVGPTEVECYIKVQTVGGSKERMSADVQWYKNDAAGEKMKTSTADFVPDLSGVNFIAQAYEYLKTLPEFAGAANC